MESVSWTPDDRLVFVRGSEYGTHIWVSERDGSNAVGVGVSARSPSASCGRDSPYECGSKGETCRQEEVRPVSLEEGIGYPRAV
jgi:hypothetical protein